jgi:hypothetical protein
MFSSWLSAISYQSIDRSIAGVDLRTIFDGRVSVASREWLIADS